MMMGTRLLLLGPLAVTIDDGPAPAALLWRKHIGLLVYLALSPGRRRTRDHLIGVFWAEKPESAARHSLTEALRVVRSALGSSAVLSDAGEIRLTGDAVDLDTDRFLEFCEGSRWHAAVELLRGEFMEGFTLPDASAFEDWLAAERREWRLRAAGAFVRLADARLAVGSSVEAAAAAERALRIEPADEAAWRIGMLARALQGDRSGALAWWDECVRTLDDRFGIEPGAETADLAALIRRERHWKHMADTTNPDAAVRRAPLAGREGALTTAMMAWRRCIAGESAIVLVTGDPGAGRSRFIDEMAARVRLSGALTAMVRAVPGDAAHNRSTLDALLAGISAGGAGREREPATDAIAAIDSATRQQALLLAVDDAHLADAVSLLELLRSVRTLPRARLLVLLTAAPFPHRQELDALAARIGRDVPGATIAVEPLTTAQVHELIRWALPAYDAAATERLTRRLMAETAGLPLLLVELLHAIVLGLEMTDDVQPWPSAMRTMDHTLPAAAPASITAAIRVGFRRLDPTAQHTLAALALLGERVPAVRLESATGIPSAQVAAALDELEWQRWIVADPRGFGYTARIARTIVANDLITGGERQRILARAAAIPAS